MNARERFQNILKYESIDRPPLIALEPYEQSAIKRWEKEGLPYDISPIEFLNMDPILTVPIIFDPIPPFEHRVIFENDEEIVETDWLGSTIRRLKEAPTMFYGHIDHPIKTRDDWERYKEHFDPTSPGRLPTKEEIERLNNSEAPVVLHVWPYFFRFCFYTMGMERFLIAFYEAPDLIHDIFSFWSKFVLDSMRPLLPHIQIDCVVFPEDLAYKNGPHISPGTYEEFWLPYQDPIVTELRKNGVQYFCLWTSGNIDVLIPLLLEHGINCTWPLERTAGMDPVALRKKYGRSLRLGGGIAKEALISGPRAIDREIERLVPIIEDGGFIPAIDDMIPPEVPFSHYRYYLETLNEVKIA